ncbi:Bug family tripartite tricarboxylate transporter substrate binding protein [Bradyrhizobium roseum]|uniref:Bug family tripartite tricarboxylate transporter substrate binding protein n=1 Tax=Bradyrhizobium roseum TaxID=3056648 RepID=UPI0026137D28|nr:tripartite tricarboxylate transporter substrate binding protein [Bradyrhizobium roseus]WKA25801.1 tripartite tricarboxylate transporter substrate binding protein [Bradyrhizobium roseus]
MLDSVDWCERNDCALLLGQTRGLRTRIRKRPQHNVLPACFRCRWLQALHLFSAPDRSAAGSHEEVAGSRECFLQLSKFQPYLNKEDAMNVVRNFRAVMFTMLPLTAATFANIAQVTAQQFPYRTITIVVPGAPATPPDVISRVIATELSESEGWRVTVENKAGAVQTLGGAEVLKHPADGHTIFAMAVPVSAAPAFLPNMPFRLETDFAPVIKLSTSYNVLVVNPAVPAKSVSELVALVKGQPDKLTFSSGGFGTPAHLIGEMFKLQTGTRATHVPYNQFPQAIGDLLNGTNHFMFITTLPVVDLIAAGKLRALAVTGPKRIAALPDVPTIVEQGFPNLVVEDWVGFAVKSGTPNDVIGRLNEAINKALGKPKVREAFARVGAEPAGGTSLAYGELIKSQMAHWAKVVKDSGIKMGQ